MVKDVVRVKYKAHDVGAVSFNTETGIGSFEFEPRFIKTGIELSPIKMPLSRKIYSFPEADPVAFKGLPGMIADSLPDDFTQVRSGQTDVPEGFTHFIIKFDGVSEHNRDRETFGDPLGYGTMEYVYHLMAKHVA